MKYQFKSFQYDANLYTGIVDHESIITDMLEQYKLEEIMNSRMRIETLPIDSLPTFGRNSMFEGITLMEFLTNKEKNEI